MFLANVQCTVQGEKEKKIITFEPKVAQRVALPFQTYIFSKYQTSAFKSKKSTFFFHLTSNDSKGLTENLKKISWDNPVFHRAAEKTISFFVQFFLSYPAVVGGSVVHVFHHSTSISTKTKPIWWVSSTPFGILFRLSVQF
jgi:hypothetical protein